MTELEHLIEAACDDATIWPIVGDYLEENGRLESEAIRLYVPELDFEFDFGGGDDAGGDGYGDGFGGGDGFGVGGDGGFGVDGFGDGGGISFGGDGSDGNIYVKRTH